MKNALRLLHVARGSDRLERDLEDELQFHVEMRVADNIRQGMALGAARANALHRFGNIEHTKSLCRQLSVENTADLKRLKSCLWLVAGIGLVIRAIASINGSELTKLAGEVPAALAMLWRLLIYVQIDAARHIRSFQNTKTMSVGFSVTGETNIVSLRAQKLVIWLLTLAGLAVFINGEAVTQRLPQVGLWLIASAFFWRSLLHVRAAQPAKPMVSIEGNSGLFAEEGRKQLN